MPISYENLGFYNKQLVLDLRAGNLSSSGALISEWRHKQVYNYDLSYGVIACGNPGMKLKGHFVGIKYYCSDKYFNFDMKKRIVHIYDTRDRVGTQRFYRLVHTKGDPEVRDNSYSRCDLITNIPVT